MHNTWICLFNIWRLLFYDRGVFDDDSQMAPWFMVKYKLESKLFDIFVVQSSIGGQRLSIKQSLVKLDKRKSRNMAIPNYNTKHELKCAI